MVGGRTRIKNRRNATQALLTAQSRRPFIAWGDLVHLSAIQIAYPDTALTYDLDPEMARRSRRRMLDMVAAERIVVAGAHVNAPGFGHVVRRGTSFKFEPA